MRHVSVRSIQAILYPKRSLASLGHLEPWDCRFACNWQAFNFMTLEHPEVIQDIDMRRFLNGHSVTPPTCPDCAVLMDLALEMSASNE